MAVELREFNKSDDSDDSDDSDESNDSVESNDSDESYGSDECDEVALIKHDRHVQPLRHYEELVAQVAAFVQDGTLTPVVQGFIDLVKRGWWSRIWVIQEAVVAKSALVILGNRNVSLHGLLPLLRTYSGRLQPCRRVDMGGYGQL